MKIVMVALFGAAMVATPALAGPQDAAPGKDKVASKVKGDPNKMICRTDGATGSRLQKTRRCATAAEWEEIRQTDRREIDKVQANRYNGNS